MSRPRALDLFCCAGGVSVGLARAGFDVSGVDLNPKVEKYWRRGMEPYGGTFVCANALEYPLEGFDLICASPPCQAHSVLRRINPGKEYPDLIPATRERLQAHGGLWVIENVPGAPLGGGSSCLIQLCGTMFGLQTPDGRAEIRRHRLFECSFSIPLRPACQHGHVSSLSVSGHAAEIPPKSWAKKTSVITVSGDRPNSANTPKVICVAGGKAMSGGMMTPQGELMRRAISVTGNTAQTNTVRNTERQTFSTDDARAAMGIKWMPMQYLSQAIPPAYAEWIGRQALEVLKDRGCT